MLTLGEPVLVRTNSEGSSLSNREALKQTNSCVTSEGVSHSFISFTELLLHMWPYFLLILVLLFLLLSRSLS